MRCAKSMLLSLSPLRFCVQIGPMLLGGQGVRKGTRERWVPLLVFRKPVSGTWAVAHDNVSAHSHVTASHRPVPAPKPSPVLQLCPACTTEGHRGVGTIQTQECCWWRIPNPNARCGAQGGKAVTRFIYSVPFSFLNGHNPGLRDRV